MIDTLILSCGVGSGMFIVVMPYGLAYSLMFIPEKFLYKSMKDLLSNIKM